MSDFLQESGSVYAGHLVYKAGYAHGNLYIDKEKFQQLGATRLINLVRDTAENAVREGLNIGGHKKIGVLGPAYGAIPLTVPLAASLECLFPDVIFFGARTEVVKVEGRNVHVIPEKLLQSYRGLPFIGIEDIVNNGTTIRETSNLLRIEADALILAWLSIVDRGGQTFETLKIDQYYPGRRVSMDQCDLRKGPCLQCQTGEPITTHLGKGKEWVDMFGQPPYPPDTNFSQFWA